jgi:hypothetical protein
MEGNQADSKIWQGGLSQVATGRIPRADEPSAHNPFDHLSSERPLLARRRTGNSNQDAVRIDPA